MSVNNALWQRAQRVLAGGPGTFSKHWKRYPQGIGPAALVSGDGCYVVGTDGKTYLDTVAALGPIILGYNHPVVTRAVIEQVKYGTSFSMLHPLEIDVAELLCELLPSAEMVRFMRNGTDATNAAVRLARAVTGHRNILFAGYHGGAMDSYGITTDRSKGILPQLFPYNHQTPWGDLSSVPPDAYDDLAAIMVEVPPMPWGSDGQPVTEMLQHYCTLAHTHGALFVLDEVVTFPRVSIHGAQHWYGVMPDLCTVSKAIANGLPLAALVGKRDIMAAFDSGEIFVSYTFAGETTGLAACKATLEVLRDTEALYALHRHGTDFGDRLQELLQTYALPATLWGDASRLAIRWHAEANATPDMLKTLWLAEHAKRGVLHGGGVMLPMACWSMDTVHKLLSAAEEVCSIMRKALDEGNVMACLECDVITNVLSVR